MRRVTLVTITREGRDKGKSFELKEAPSDQAERWANRLIIVLANAGTRLPEGSLSGGMAGLAFSMEGILLAGLRAIEGLKFDGELKSLLDEMVPCIKFKPPGGAPAQSILPGDNCQIEEIRTWWELRYELIELHLGFSLAGAVSTSASDT